MPSSSLTPRVWRLAIVLMVAALLAFVPAAVQAGRDATLTIRSNTTLTEDVFVPVVVARDGITLDCAGYRIVGAGSGKGITLDGRSGITVRNCDISNFGTGILVANTSGSVIEANSVHDSRLPGRVVAGGINGAGIWVQDSSDNRFLGNESYANAGTGINANSSSNNLLVGNNFSDNNLAGLFFAHGSNENHLEDNTANNNGESGFYIVEGASSNTLVANTASGNAWQGFDLNGQQTGNLLIDNIATGNADNGFLLNPGADGNTLRENAASGNGSHGFLLVGVTGNTLTGNGATANYGGFVLADASGNTLSGNDGSANSYGFAAVGTSSANLFSYNVAHDNTVYDGYQDVSGPANTWIDNDFGTTFGL